MTGLYTQSKAVRRAAYFLKTEGETSLADELTDAAKTIDMVLEAFVLGWTKTSNQLPKPHDVVIIPGGVGYITNDGAWFTLTGCDYPGKAVEWPVDYWMEFPKYPSGIERRLPRVVRTTGVVS